MVSGSEVNYDVIIKRSVLRHYHIGGLELSRRSVLALWSHWLCRSPPTLSTDSAARAEAVSLCLSKISRKHAPRTSTVSAPRSVPCSSDKMGKIRVPQREGWFSG